MGGKRALLGLLVVAAVFAGILAWVMRPQAPDEQQVAAAAAARAEEVQRIVRDYILANPDLLQSTQDEAEAANAAAARKEEIGQVVREYVLANPELLEEAIDLLRERREKEAASAQAKTIEESGELIFSSSHQAVLGNSVGAITLVEFFDYNCGYCRRALSDMTALIDANADLRVVMKEFPILSEGSMQAARISVAVKDLAPERYLEFHIGLFSQPGQADGTKALEVARGLGLDVEALKKAAEASGVSANIEEVRGLASSLGISGTPSYVIGKEIVPGAIGFDGLQEKVAAMRNCGATLC